MQPGRRSTSTAFNNISILHHIAKCPQNPPKRTDGQEEGERIRSAYERDTQKQSQCRRRSTPPRSLPTTKRVSNCGPSLGRSGQQDRHRGRGGRAGEVAELSAHSVFLMRRQTLLRKKTNMFKTRSNTVWCKKNSCMFEFPTFLSPTNLGRTMHSPSALTEHVSLNLARFFARPCT